MKQIRKFISKYIAIIVFFALWELITRIGVVDSLFIPPFSTVVRRIFQLFRTDNLTRHILESLFRALSGLIIATVVAIPLGTILACSSKKLNLALEPVWDVLSQVNPFILYHLLVFSMGIGQATKITSISWLCLWPILFSTVSGIVNTDPLILKAASGFGLGRLQTVIKILLPSAAPSIFTSLRLSASYSLMMLIAVEMMQSSNGLGWMLSSSQEIFDTGAIFSVLVIIVLLNLIIDNIIRYFEERAAFHEYGREDEGIPRNN